MEEIIWYFVGIAIFVLGFWAACKVGQKNYDDEYYDDEYKENK